MKKSSRLSYAVLASTLLVVPLARADLVVSTVLTDQDIKTSAQGDITITNNGQLAMTTNGVNNGDAILIDSADALITIDAGNLNADGNAILVTGTGRYGINIDATDAQINLGAGSAITSTTDDAIYVNNSGAEISSTGTISGDASAINVTTNGTNTTISLLAGSTTQGNTAPTISVNASGLSFGNSGTVLSVDQDAILLRESVSNFQNNALGIINTSGAGNAINLDNAAAGTINNSGFIGVDGTGSAISITNTFNGSIVNSLSGIIATSGGGGNGNHCQCRILRN